MTYRELIEVLSNIPDEFMEKEIEVESVKHGNFKIDRLEIDGGQPLLIASGYH